MSLYSSEFLSLRGFLGTINVFSCKYVLVKTRVIFGMSVFKNRTPHGPMCLYLLVGLNSNILDGVPT